VNLLSINKITHLGSGKKVEFNPDSVIIFDLSNGLKIIVGEVNHHSRLYTFSKFTHKYDYISILTYDNEYYIFLFNTLYILFIQRSVNFDEGPSQVLPKKSTPPSPPPLVAEVHENYFD
jgi:hypothetical protein